MAIQQIASFMTSDGKRFATMEEAQIHEIQIDMANDIEGIGAAHDIPARTISTLTKWLPVFIAELGYVKAPEPVTFSDSEESPAVA